LVIYGHILCAKLSGGNEGNLSLMILFDVYLDGKRMKKERYGLREKGGAKTRDWLTYCGHTYINELIH